MGDKEQAKSGPSATQPQAPCWQRGASRAAARPRPQPQTNCSLKLGAAKKEAGRAYGLVKVRLPAPDQRWRPDTFAFALDRQKLRQVRRREGRYLLRSNLPDEDPAQLWRWYIQLTEVEQENNGSCWIGCA